MLTYTTLGAEEAQRAIDVAVDQAQHDSRPMAVAVADVHGDLIACLRMNGAAPRVLRHAIRKAYTAAVMARDTLTFKADLVSREGNLSEWGDPRLTTLQGGVAVRLEGKLVGAIGVGGNTVERDTEIAQAARLAVTGQQGER